MESSHVHHGSCLCGGVSFEMTDPCGISVCHCSQCRRTSGHIWAATSVPLGDFHLIRAETLRWFPSSPEAQRGFCATCGASLFWQLHGEGRMHAAPGAFDDPTGLTFERHIFSEDAADYYRPEGPPPVAVAAAPNTLDCACLCGAVAFSLSGPTGPITACHCRQCRKLSGYYAASFDADESTLVWHGKSGLAEYQTPGHGRRGFCEGCGSSLYFRSAMGEFSIEIGAVTGPTGGRLSEHIFVGSKGDHYDITDGLPQHGRV
ncbi:MAG: GFA family protein [Albidovulum sp.]